MAPGLERRGVVAAFTERGGGVSEGPYASLNLALHTGDDAAPVAENRRRVEEALSAPALATVRQVHGSRLVPIEEAGEGCDADGIVLGRVGPSATVLVADCIPLALASEERAAAVHVGWRGLAAGLAAAAVEAVGGPAAAALGPAIGPCHYEVGPEVVEAVERGIGSAVTRRDGGRTFLDLPGTLAAHLGELGVRDLERAGECTACEPERFFSHRRDGRTGRQALVLRRV